MKYTIVYLMILYLSKEIWMDKKIMLLVIFFDIIVFLMNRPDKD